MLTPGDISLDMFSEALHQSLSFLDSDMPGLTLGGKICKLYIATWCAKHQKFDSMQPFLQELFLETQKWII